MSLSKEEFRDCLAKLMDHDEYSTDWVSPEWEPITKVKEENRRLMMFVLNRCLGAVFNDEPDLGLTIVKWTKCHPDREFLIGPDEDMAKYLAE